MFVVEYIAMAPYHPRSDGLAEFFVDAFKRALENQIKKLQMR